MVIAEASKYQSRTEFKSSSSVAYRKALQWGMLDALFPIEIVVIDKIKPIKKKTIIRERLFDGAAIEDDARYIMADRDCDELKHRAARDYTGEALAYYWAMIRKHGG
jgi:hypothetical protein